MKPPNFTCMPTLWSRWAQHKNFVFLFLNLHMVISDLTQKISPTFWQIKLNEDRWSLKQCESTIYSVSNVLVCSQPKNKTMGLKVARYSFSRSIPPKFERKLCRHKQIIFKPVNKFFRKFNSLEINRPFMWPLSFKIIDIIVRQ